MAIDTEHVPHRTEYIEEIMQSEPPAEYEVLESWTETYDDAPDRDLYRIRREITVSSECYRVWTAGAKGSKRWTYIVEQNDNDDWEVTSKEMYHGRWNRTEQKTPESTDAVRDALRERHGIEVIN